MNNIYDDSGNNNAPDYENDLVFEPKSADDLNKQGRQSEVLIKALEKCEMLEKQLEIAVKALEFYEKPFVCFHPEYNIAQHHKKAAEALAKIKELDK